MPRKAAGSDGRPQGVELLYGRGDGIGRVFDRSEKIVGCGKPGDRIFDRGESTMDGGGDVTCQDVRLVCFVYLAQLDRTGGLETEQRVQLSSDDGLVEAGGEFVRMLHMRELARRLPRFGAIGGRTRGAACVPNYSMVRKRSSITATAGMSAGAHSTVRRSSGVAHNMFACSVSCGTPWSSSQ